jgi:hypothetical protein
MYLNLVSRTSFDIEEIWVIIKQFVWICNCCGIIMHVLLNNISFLVRHVRKDEKKYYQDLLSHSREHLMVWVLHCQAFYPPLSTIVLKQWQIVWWDRGLPLHSFLLIINIVETWKQNCSYSIKLVHSQQLGIISVMFCLLLYTLYMKAKPTRIWFMIQRHIIV